MSKIMISVGEASGDMHGASVALALQSIQPDIEIFGMGGKAMRAAGVNVVYDIADLGVIGFVEVVKNLRRLFKLRDNLGEIMDRERPDALVIIDYHGFNIRLAKVAKQKGIPVIYYICPKVWAWGKWRAKEIAENVVKIAAIFPFEIKLYAEAGADVSFVGNPLLDIVKTTMSKQEAYTYFGVSPERPVVLLLPGSRQQEIVKLLPVMLESAQQLQSQMPDCQFVLPIASTISREMINNLTKQYKISVILTEDHTYDLMSIAQMGIAASGTVTLEAAILGLPTVIIYKLATLTYMIGKIIFKSPYIGLPNIVAGREIIPELIQGEVTAEHVTQAALPMLQDGPIRTQMLADLLAMRQSLGETGAVQRVAHEILAVAQHPVGGRE